jgi:hypothetical protein
VQKERMTIACYGCVLSRLLLLSYVLFALPQMERNQLVNAMGFFPVSFDEIEGSWAKTCVT